MLGMKQKVTGHAEWCRGKAKRQEIRREPSR